MSYSAKTKFTENPTATLVKLQGEFLTIPYVNFHIQKGDTDYPDGWYDSPNTISIQATDEQMDELNSLNPQTAEVTVEWNGLFHMTGITFTS